MGKEHKIKDLCPGYVQSSGDCELCATLGVKIQDFNSDGGIPNWVSPEQAQIIDHYSKVLPPCAETIMRGGERFDSCRFRKKGTPERVARAQTSPKDNPLGMSLVILSNLFCAHPLHKPKEVQLQETFPD